MRLAIYFRPGKLSVSPPDDTGTPIHCFSNGRNTLCSSILFMLLLVHLTRSSAYFMDICWTDCICCLLVVHPRFTVDKEISSYCLSRETYSSSYTCQIRPARPILCWLSMLSLQWTFISLNCLFYLNMYLLKMVTESKSVYWLPTW